MLQMSTTSASILISKFISTYNWIWKWRKLERISTTWLCKWYLWSLFFKSAGFPQPGNLRLNVIYGTTIRGDLVWEVSDGHYSSLPSTHAYEVYHLGTPKHKVAVFPQFLLILSDVLALKFARRRLWQLLFTLHIVNSCRTACTTVTTTMLTASITCACTIENEW